MSDSGRPSQKTQKSRKGKKAWRKNIDLDELEKTIDNKREAEIHLGPGPLFSTDISGDGESLTKEMRSEKKLKAHEILNARSAVPALNAVHKKKDVKKPKVHKLVRASGRNGESALKYSIERDGLLKSGEVDPWATENPVVREAIPPQAPIPDAKPVEIPDEGRSYNPSLDAWKSTISEEHARLEKIEAERLKAEEAQARIEALLNMPSDDEDVESESEEEVVDGRISVNGPVKNKKKSKQQINKQRRHKERERLHAELRAVRKQLHDLHNLPQILASLPKSKGEEEPQKKPKVRRKAHSKHAVMAEPFAIKLSDELDDSLRRIKPEGNIAKERFRSFQARGLIEARVPLTKKDKRKARRKIVEKWSYKDVTLNKSQ